MSCLTQKIAQLNSPNPRRRFAALQHLCEHAEGLNLLQRSELVIAPVVKMLSCERNDDVLEAGLNSLARALQLNLGDVELVLQLGQDSPRSLEMVLALIGRLPAVVSAGGNEKPDFSQQLFSKLASFTKSADEPVRQSALILLQILKAAEVKFADWNDEWQVTNSKTRLTDPLMRRRWVALAPLNPNDLPHPDCLSDLCPFVRRQAMVKLFDAGSIADSHVIVALRNECPRTVINVLEEFRCHFVRATNLIDRNRAVSISIEKHVANQNTYVSERAIVFSTLFGFALRDIHPSILQTVLDQFTNGSQAIRHEVVHFVRSNCETLLELQMDYLPIMLQALQDKSHGIHADALETIAETPEGLLNQRKDLRAKIIHELKIDLQYTTHWRSLTIRALAAFGSGVLDEAPELVDVIMKSLKSQDDQVRMSAACALVKLGARVRTIESDVQPKVESALEIHHFHSEANHWPFRMMIGQFLNCMEEVS